MQRPANASLPKCAANPKSHNMPQYRLRDLQFNPKQTKQTEKRVSDASGERWSSQSVSPPCTVHTVHQTCKSWHHHDMFIMFMASCGFLMFLEEDYGPYGFGPGAGVSSWPDLTERLKKVGAYEKYLEWREGDRGHKMCMTCARASRSKKKDIFDCRILP